MPICVDRERRPNAGARMAKLLNEEEEDEFYTSIYGGFTEEANDADYESESSVEDIIDSDFESDPSAAESEEAASDEENEKRKKRRRHSGVVTKAYKEPKRSKKEEDRSKPIQVDDPSDSQAKATPRSKEVPRTSSSEVISEPRSLRPRAQPIATAENKISGDRRSLRTGDANATALRREAILAEIAQRKNVPEVRRLTQEELLAEAKLTEELNRRSLARYQRLEVEKKKAHFQKTKQSVPMIRYHSFAAPLIDEKPQLYGVSIDTETSTIRAGPIITDPSARCCRNLITFADSNCLRNAFPRTATPLPDPTCPVPNPPHPRRRMQICPISGLPARYLDPLTLTPYANLAAFRVLRRLYRIHLETNTPAIDLLREYRNSC
ncbi:vacuolar protein sorting-associated protein 72 [Paragonimus westermani]|uniref:Vacuolar protein sorting-associated protein 72 homolog n=1 Tax=Paragonimus westermani TaxID=34504 RepID=A0A5J4NIJ6_9TREM|nr:vacuolar protein sorting-associated protein 72 [Paragonimus westermani]